MDIKTQFILQHKLQAYQTPKFYEDTTGKKTKRQSNKSVSKKLTIFDQIIKAHSKTPGPAKYVINPEVKIKEKLVLITKQQPQVIRSKQTFFDSLIKRSMSLPSVGKYNIAPTKKIIQSNQSQKSLTNFRPTLFDYINESTVNIGPGLYSHHKNLSQKNLKYSISPEPKKPISLPNIPSPCDYNPLPSSYSTFERKSFQSMNQDSTRKHTFGQRTKEKIKQKSPGPVYNLITDWGKRNPQKSQFNLYKSVYSGPKQSVYHSITHR